MHWLFLLLAIAAMALAYITTSVGVLAGIGVVGATGLVWLDPLIALAVINANQNFPFGGTSILIMVGVGLETVKQIDSQLQQRHYEGLLR